MPGRRRLSVASRVTIRALALAIAAASALTPGTAAGSSLALVGILFSTFVGGGRFGLAAWALSMVLNLVLLWPVTGPNVWLSLAVLAGAGLVALVMAGVVRGTLGAAEWRTHRLLHLVHAAEGVVFVVDAAGRLHREGGGYSVQPSLDWNSLRGRRWLRIVHLDDRARLPRALPPEGSKAHQVELRLRTHDGGEWRWYRLTVVPVYDARGDVVEWLGTARDIHDGKAEADRREIAFAEARHRLKNLIAIIEALAKYSGPRPGTEPAIDAFLKRFSGRLHALASASDLLLARRLNQTLEINALVRATLEPFLAELPHRFAISGPDIELSEQLGGALALAVHELATNALKYGALSVPSGRVAVRWDAAPIAGGEEFVFEWKEHGGPMPFPPTRQGFGTRLIKSVAARERSGRVAIDYESDGLRCRIACLLETAA